MDDPLPAAAALVGLVLGVPVALFVAFYDARLVLGATLGLLLFLPFAVYAAHSARTPTTLYPPRATLVVGTCVGVVLVALAPLSVATGAALTVGALTVALSVGYHGRYAADPLSAPLVIAGEAVLALLVVAAGVLGGAPLSTGVASAFVGAAAVDTVRERRWLTRRTRRLAATVALLGGACIVVVGVLLDRPGTGIGAATALLVVGAALAVE